MNRKIILFFLSLLALWGCQTAHETSKKPNIVYILADDLGYGDVRALNPQGKINTAHIDKLAREGMIFTNAHSGSSVCTPTRYGILTGQYAWRTRLKKGVLWGNDPHLIEPQRKTVATLLRENGYHTACIGKWHLGVDWGKDAADSIDYRQPFGNGPTTLGFDYFYGIPASLDIPPYLYLENDRTTAHTIGNIEANSGKGFWRAGAIGDDVVHDQTLQHLADQAVAYIGEHANDDQPFFLYFPLTAPHTPVLPTPAFKGRSNLNEYGDFVMMVDDVVGQVMNVLDKHQLTDNTLVIFTSDNGFAPMADLDELIGLGHNPNHVFRGHKADIWEGGHHIPFIAHWPARIAGGRHSEETISLTDFFATAAAIAGATIADDAGEDSFNLLPLLTGETDTIDREAVVVHSMNGSFAIIDDQMKLIFCPGSGGWKHTPRSQAEREGLPLIQLYDLRADIGEQHNLAPEKPAVVEALTKKMEQLLTAGRSTRGNPQRGEDLTLLEAPE